MLCTVLYQSQWGSPEKLCFLPATSYPFMWKKMINCTSGKISKNEETTIIFVKVHYISEVGLGVL